MKIIKEGKLPTPKITFYRGTCNNCGCEVEVTSGENIYLNIVPAPGVGRLCPSIVCPTNGCNTVIYLDVMRK